MTFVLSLLTGAWGRIAGLLALALGALVIARKSGADANELKHAKADAEARKRADEVISRAPPSVGEALRRFDEGKRL